MTEQPNQYSDDYPPAERSFESNEPLAGESGMVNQITIVAILQIVQGGFECLMALMLLGFTIFFSVGISGEEIDISEGEVYMLLAIYGGLFVLVLASAIFRIVTGVACLKFKWRIPTVISLSAGFITLMTCYCGPTAIALGIYGIIVLLSPPAAKAFRMRQNGMTVQEIKHAFQMASAQPTLVPPEQFVPTQNDQNPYA